MRKITRILTQILENRTRPCCTRSINRFRFTRNSVEIVRLGVIRNRSLDDRRRVRPRSLRGRYSAVYYTRGDGDDVGCVRSRAAGWVKIGSRSIDPRRSFARRGRGGGKGRRGTAVCGRCRTTSADAARSPNIPATRVPKMFAQDSRNIPSSRYRTHLSGCVRRRFQTVPTRIRIEPGPEKSLKIRNACVATSRRRIGKRVRTDRTRALFRTARALFINHNIAIYF